MVARKENGIYVVSDSFALNRYDFDGSADLAKANIDLVVKKARAMGMVGEGSFDFDVSRSYYGDDLELVITYYFTRVENDNERGDREAAEARVKAAASAKRKATAEKKKLKDDAEYVEFLRLKEKFRVLEK